MGKGFTDFCVVGAGSLEPILSPLDSSEPDPVVFADPKNFEEFDLVTTGGAVELVVLFKKEPVEEFV